jgi:hypothetical protein
MSKLVTLQELKDHAKKDSLWVLIHEKGLCLPNQSQIFGLSDVFSVYDVSKFIDEVFLLLERAPFPPLFITC